MASILPMIKRQFIPLSGCRAAGFCLLCLCLMGAADPKPGDIILQDAVSYRVEGRDLQEAGELQRASAAFRRAVTLNPKYAEAYNDLGVVLESMGDIGNAERAYQEALVVKPDLAAAHTNLALLYEEIGRPQDAVQHWGERIRLGPPDDPWVERAHQKMSQYGIPVQDTPEQAAAKVKEQVRLAVLSGQTHMDAADYDQAILEFERALSLEPGNSKAARLLGVSRVKAAEAERKRNREMEASKRRVLREQEKLGQDRSREDREEERRSEELRMQQEARARQMQREADALAKKQQREASSETVTQEIPPRQVERPKVVRVVEPVRIESRAPWWEFWAREPGEVTENSRRIQLDRERRREKELEREVERARQIQAAQPVEIRRETAAAVTPAPVPVKPAPVKVAQAPAPVPSTAPAPIVVPVRPATTVRQPAPSQVARPADAPAAPVVRVAPPSYDGASAADARRLADEYARERYRNVERARVELYQRGAAAMREGNYREAAEQFRQVLTLDPDNQDAKQALSRAEKAWEREQQAQY